MDLDNLQQNMNTRVVFKEPRGMVRWLQLLFAIIAVSTICDFHSSIGINITCPTKNAIVTTTPPPSPSSTSSTSPSPSSSTSSPTSSPSPSPSPTPANNSAPSNNLTASPQAPAEQLDLKLIIEYPFDFKGVSVNNTCAGNKASLTHVPGLSGSPEFFVMTGFLSLFYAAATLVVYLLFSSTYDSYPVVPVADLIITAILCLLWFVASSSFSSGVSILKSTVTYQYVKQVLCQESFEQQAGALCVPNPEYPDWKSINVGLVSGFTSFFLWGFGLWFVFKETHFHNPRGPLSL